MKVSALSAILRPFDLAFDKKSMVSDYKSVVLTKKGAAARTARVMLRVETLEELELAENLAVQGGMLYSQLRFLPPDHDIKLHVKDGNLEWHLVGAESKGRIATMPFPEIHDMPPMPADRIVDTKDFGELLELGSMAAQNSALSSVGLYGVMLYANGDDLWCLSSNGDTLVSAKRKIPSHHSGHATIYPQEVEFLQELATYKNGGFAILGGKDPRAIRFSAETNTIRIDAAVALIPQLRHDLWGVAQEHIHGEVEVPLQKERLAAFVRRAEFLSESAQKTDVTLSVDKNAIGLAFAGALASADENYQLAEELPVPQKMTAVLSSRELAKALKFCDVGLLDRMDKGVLTLKSKEGDFFYVITGK